MAAAPASGAACGAAPLAGARDATAPVSSAEFARLMAPLGPFGAAPAIAAAVSGGPHSLALALLADDWARARGGSLLALIADHGLRPESGAEAEAVAAQLAARGIASRLLRLGLSGGSGVQERARAARYAALLDACGQEGRPWLLLGHHRLDQAETLLLRLLAGSGPAGLAGMAPARAVAEALLLRPLLSLPPARLEATLAAAGLTPVRDPSNRDRRFTRIRLREALADPGGEGPGVAALADAATAFARRAGRQRAAVAARLAWAAVLHPAGFARIDLAALGEDAVADAALAALVQAVAGAAFPPPPAAVAVLRRRGEGTLAGAWLRRGLLLREPALLAPPLPARHGALWDGRFRLTGPGAPDAELGALGLPGPELRAAARGLTAAIVTTMPAVRRHGALVAVPLLLYPDARSCAPFALAFAPRSGPVGGAGMV